MRYRPSSSHCPQALLTSSHHASLVPNPSRHSLSLSPGPVICLTPLRQKHRSLPPQPSWHRPPRSTVLSTDDCGGKDSIAPTPIACRALNLSRCPRNGTEAAAASTASTSPFTAAFTTAFTTAVMKWTPLAFVGLAANSFAAAAVANTAKPDGAAPAGCGPSHDGKFEVTIYSVTPAVAKRNVVVKKRATTCNSDKTLVLTLADSVLTDSKDRTGYISSSFQLQFDGPPQSGAIFTAGFSYCTNGSLALGPTTVFYRCQSGNFYNLYDRHWAPQCEPVEIVAMPCEDGGDEDGGDEDGGDEDSHPPPLDAEDADGSDDANDANNSNLGQTEILPTNVVKGLSNGQHKNCSTSVAYPICQIADGQIQIHSTPCAQAPIHVATAPAGQNAQEQPRYPTGTVSNAAAAGTGTGTVGSASSTAPSASQPSDGLGPKGTTRLVTTAAASKERPTFLMAALGVVLVALLFSYA
ncbi:hypothetical protein RJ55_08708 [Drechmeria coniospora]|nr:hypothetical protein RJ55_08708 [Drechmeria coniospora]